MKVETNLIKDLKMNKPVISEMIRRVAEEMICYQSDEKLGMSISSVKREKTILPPEAVKYVCYLRTMPMIGYCQIKTTKKKE